MKLVLSEEHQLLRATAAEFVRSKSSLKRIRALRDSGDTAGFSRDLWHEMAALGWAGIVIAEEHGGSGLGYSHLMVVMEELGRGLMPEPMVPTVLGSAAITLGGSGAAATVAATRGRQGTDAGHPRLSGARAVASTRAVLRRSPRSAETVGRCVAKSIRCSAAGPRIPSSCRRVPRAGKRTPPESRSFSSTPALVA